MSASQDKVQAILQTLLEQSLPLVHKGVFTQQQLQVAMCQREKHENNMLKPTFKLSDYLKAIQFQYSIERIRRNRIQTLAPNNPLFKKQTKTDFVVIKRIIRLWDRTMHKFKYNVQLWKQYLDFCIKTHSKNQFYKALSNSLRFLPGSQDLWLIGVNYEIQVGLNLWKARKIFIKALKMNKKNTNLWIQMFKFQLTFLKTLFERQKAIQGSQKMHFINNQLQQQQEQENQLQIGQQNEQVKKFNNIDLSQHDDILLYVYQEAISKVDQQYKSDLKKQIISILKDHIKKQRDSEINKILKSALKKIQNSSNVQVQSKIQASQQIDRKNHLQKSTFEEKLQYYQSYISENQDIQIAALDKIVCQFLTRPILLTSLLSHYLQVSGHKGINYILRSKNFKAYNLPGQLLQKIINLLSKEDQNQKNLENLKKLLKNIPINSYVIYPKLLESVVKINKKMKNFKTNNDIYRSISIICKKQPEIIERCMYWIRDQDF